MTWPSLCATCEDTEGRLMGYILGKAEGQGSLWHGHVTAVTVSSDHRRLGLASLLMKYLETTSEFSYDAYFVDLFVRVSNILAIFMYSSLDYHIYRRVLEYYSGEEDAFDMRKALQRDKEKKSIVPLLNPITPDMLEW
jgi:N-terminal acetyltransferase B complex catalytic subunit